MNFEFSSPLCVISLPLLQPNHVHIEGGCLKWALVVSDYIIYNVVQPAILKIHNTLLYISLILSYKTYIVLSLLLLYRLVGLLNDLLFHLVTCHRN